ncbi:MAG: TerC family protein [Sphingobacteriales bacterium]|nr:MAG: TerC family protein [Sphingobacteriales bacterium]
MSKETTLWVGFNLFIFFMLFLDLFVFNRKQHTIKVKEALLWTGFWMLLAGLFAVGIYFFGDYFFGLGANGESQGSSLALEFTTGYLIEQALSIDNLFVILMLFTFFRTPHAFQHKVLFWGILGAIFFRILFILLGVALIERFAWMTYLLGGFLIFTSIKMILEKDQEINPEKNAAIKIFSKIMPVSKFYDGSNFFTRQNGIRHATPLFVALIVVETTDIVFALDSIPAILAISRHSFIVYSSNIFAVLGLRSLYFALAGIMELFHFLHYGLSAILLFVGVKIILHTAHIFEVPVFTSLIVVAGILVLSILLSIIFPEKNQVPQHNPHTPHDPPKHPKAM